MCHILKGPDRLQALLRLQSQLVLPTALCIAEQAPDPSDGAAYKGKRGLGGLNRDLCTRQMCESKSVA